MAIDHLNAMTLLFKPFIHLVKISLVQLTSVKVKPGTICCNSAGTGA